MARIGGYAADIERIQSFKDSLSGSEANGISENESYGGYN